MTFGGVELWPAQIDPEDRPYVPKWDEGYEPDKGLLSDIALCVEQDLNLLLTGPTGCGKTSSVLALAALLGQPVERVNLHGDVRSGDFLGEKVVELDEATGQAVVVWRDGVLPRAMRTGRWLVVDEIDAAPASILMTLQSVLEPWRRLTLSANHGEVVVPIPGFRLIATANTIGRGDETGLYVGTNVLNEATLDRFVVRECGYLSQGREIRLLQGRTGISRDLATKMVAVADLIRSGAQREECYTTFSTRRLVSWAALVVCLGGRPADVRRGYRLAVAGKLSAEDRSYVAAIVQRIFGIDLK